MKNANTLAVFAAAVKAKVEKADALGTKTTWDTSDHLSALAKALGEADIPSGIEPEKVFLDILEDGYNISGFQQQLAAVPAYSAKGHFQRSSKKAPTVNALYAALGVA